MTTLSTIFIIRIKWNKMDFSLIVSFLKKEREREKIRRSYV